LKSIIRLKKLFHDRGEYPVKKIYFPQYYIVMADQHLNMMMCSIIQRKSSLLPKTVIEPGRAW